MTMQYVQDVGIENIQYGVWYLHRLHPYHEFMYQRKADGWVVLKARRVRTNNEQA